MAVKTRKDYEDEAIQKNWATAQPGTTYMGERYTGWDGGSIRANDQMAAASDAGKYNYDVQLDPRSKTGVQQAIGNLLYSAQEKANQDAIGGNGTFDQNYQNYLDKIGWEDYQTVFDNLQKNKTLGLTDLNGVALEKSAGLGNPNWSYDPEYDIGSEAWQNRMKRQSEEEAAYLSSLPEFKGSGVYGANVTGFSNGMTLPTVQQAGANNPWGYDMENDKVWQAYKKQYTRGASNAMNDAVAQLAARTGGMASSYAGQVGQQQSQEYMQGLTDKVPTLYEAAYNRWQNEQDRKTQQEQADREFALKQQAQQFSQQQTLQNAAASKMKEARSNLTSLIKNGYQPTESELAAAGLTPEMAEVLMQAANKSTSKSSGGGGSNSGYGGGGNDSAMDTLLDLYNEKGADYVKNYIRLNYKNLGFSNVTNANATWENFLADNGIGNDTLAKELAKAKKMNFTDAQSYLEGYIDEDDEETSALAGAVWNEIRNDVPTTYDALIKKLGNYKPKDPILTKEDWKKRHQYTKPNISTSELNQEYARYIQNVWYSLFA